MLQLRRLVLLACLVLFCGRASFADSLKGYFNLDFNLNPVPAQGEVIFTLNGDGTIGASLLAYGPDTIQGFGFDSSLPLPESGFTPGTPENRRGWWDDFRTQLSGFACSQCGLQESWTIGNPGDYTSVWQALGGTYSSVDFVLLDSEHDWGGNAVPSGTTPEPGSLMLLGTGALAVLGAIRRKVAG